MGKNVDFDFENFATSAIATVDEIRARGISETSSAIESRINAFYRALGLPSIVSNNNILDKRNTGNIFPSGTFGSEVDINKILDTLRIRELAFSHPLGEEEISAVARDNNNSILHNAVLDKGKNIRLRGNMLPMFVNGDVAIFPQSKRVAGAFRTDDEIKSGKIEYKRPLIETIIIMRLKGEGAQNSQKQNTINTDLIKEGDIDFLNTAQSIANIILLTINNINSVLSDAITKVQDARNNLKGVDVIPTLANIAEQKPIIRRKITTVLGKDEIQKASIRDKDNLKKVTLSLLEYNDTSKLGDGAARNIKNSILGSLLVSIINPQEKNTTTENQEIGEKENKNINILISATKILDLIFGQFSGISGVDIMIVISALFSIKINNLIGLLNDESKNRLKTLVLDDTADKSLFRSSASDSLDALHFQVLDLYSKVDNSIQRTISKNKKQNQSKEGT